MPADGAAYPSIAWRSPVARALRGGRFNAGHRDAAPALRHETILVPALAAGSAGASCDS